jgi:GntR family transcriptional regulator
MPNLSAFSDLPNALYPYYQKAFGITVLRTDDRLSAVAADKAAAAALGVPTGAPLLRSERVAYDLTDRAVEYRISHFITDEHTFSVRLG